LKDPTVIQGHINRIQRALPDDPEQVIGSAKELTESTAKLVLDQRGMAYSKNDDVTALIHRAQEAVGLSPAKAPTTGPDGGTSIKRILGGASSVAMGVAEFAEPIRYRSWTRPSANWSGTAPCSLGGKRGAYVVPADALTRWPIRMHRGGNRQPRGRTSHVPASSSQK
jgi:hypothetical protein